MDFFKYCVYIWKTFGSSYELILIKFKKNYQMKKELKVLEFSRKQKLVEFVNSNAHKLEIVSISSSGQNATWLHFLWYYDI